MIILSQKIVIIKKYLWLIVGVRGNCVKFICIFQKMWYISHVSGVLSTLELVHLKGRGLFVLSFFVFSDNSWVG